MCRYKIDSSELNGSNCERDLVEHHLSMTQQYTAAAKKANVEMGGIDI